MKYIAYEWGKDKDGVLFFIQRLEEMLFHYSDDIVKAPIHNTATLIEEYLILEKDKNIKHFHLDVIAAELRNSLLIDLVIKERIGSERLNGIINELKNSQKATVHYLYGLIPSREYTKWCADYLLSHVRKNNAKNEITRGLRNWISAIIQLGYTPEYVYRYLKEVFDKEDLQDPYKTIDEFIKHFNCENNKYRVYFLFYRNMESYKDLLHDKLGIVFDDDGYFSRIDKGKNKSIVGYSETDGLDQYAAMERAYSELNIFIKFYKVISNHKKPIVFNVGLVRNLSDDNSMILPVEKTGYKSIEIEPRIDLKSMINNAVLGCQRKGLNTYVHVNKIINLHNMALNQLDLDDGFVNLWSVLEVVSSDSEKQSKIEGVIDSILPILQNDFFEKYFISLDNDLKMALKRQDYRNLLKCISQEGTSDFKIGNLVLLEEYDDLLTEVFDLLALYPNIRNRIYKLYILRNDKLKLYNTAKTYAERVKWHLYRLYRIRNGIVHAGSSNKNISLLGEHLHIYCDGVIYEIIWKLADRDYIHTIRDVLVDTKLLLKVKTEHFNNDSPIMENDVKVLFMQYFDEVDMC